MSHQHEAATLGAIMVHPDCFDAVSRLVGPSDYTGKLAEVAAVVYSLAQDGIAPDLVTVSYRLSETSRLPSVGDAYLAAVVDQAAMPGNVGYHAGKVRSAAVMRTLKGLAEEISRAKCSPETVKPECVDLPG